MDTEAIAAFDLLSRMRFACGDNGKRMQDELEVYLRDLKRDAERYRWLCDGNGYFMEERGLCGHWNEKERADKEIDTAMRE